MVELNLRDAIKDYAKDLTRLMKTTLVAEGTRAAAAHAKTYDQRIAEVRAYTSEQSIEKLEKERGRIAKSLRQTTFAFEGHAQEGLQARLDSVEDELARRRTNADGHIRLLETERTRVVERLIPNRFALHGEVHIYPVTVEIRLPGGGA
jgi:hypothetical protein